MAFGLWKSTSHILKYLTLSLIKTSDLIPNLSCTSTGRDNPIDWLLFILYPETWAQCDSNIFKANKDSTGSYKRKTASSAYNVTLWIYKSARTPLIICFASIASANVSITKIKALSNCPEQKYLLQSIPLKGDYCCLIWVNSVSPSQERSSKAHHNQDHLF